MFLEDVRGFSKNSHRVVMCECDFKIAKDCIGGRVGEYRDFRNIMDKNGGKYICLQCSRKLKFSGRNNPNCKHLNIDDKYFQNIDTEEKAYIFGWIASDGHISHNGWHIRIHKRDWRILEFIKLIIDETIKVTKGHNNTLNISVHSTNMSSDLCRHLKIEPGKKSDIVTFPKFDDEQLGWAFLRGYFDGDGTVSKPSNTKSPRCSISSNSVMMLEGIKSFTKIECSIIKSNIEFNNTDAIDFLSKLYDNASIFLHRKRDLYLDWCYWVPGLQGRYGHEFLFAWSKTDKDAIAPFKVRASDSGFDLTLIRKVKQVGNVVLYGTGLKIEPEYGWWFMIAPRSSIIKTGYLLANSPPIIDASYRGEILIPLIKYDNSLPDLQLPCRVVQMVPMPAIRCQIQEVEDLGETDRGEKGFGSSGV